MSYEGRRIRRRIISTAALGVAALALTGCMRMQVNATIGEDDTVDGTVVMAMSDEILALVGDQADDLWAESGFEGDEGVTVEDYAKDGYTGKQYTFEGTPIDEFSDADMSITREGDEFVVAGNLDMTDVTSEGMEGMEDMLDSFDITVSFTFPGAVTESNGDIKGNTVTWTPQPGEANPLEARASAIASGSSSAPIGLIIGIIAAVVVIGAVVAILLVNRRKATGAPAEAAAVEAAPAEFGYAPAAEAAAPAEAVAPVEPAAEEPTKE